MNFLKIYRNVKDVFIKPKLKLYFGTWKNEPNLPVWRMGPQIRWGKYGEIDEKWNWAKLESAEWSALGKKRHPILSKIIKKPVWQLPIWLAFHWYNDDIMYKTKWEEDDFRYEYPSHFTIVFFGLAFSITAYLKPKDKEDWLIQDQYWESILTYNYYKGDLKKTNDACGWYNRPGEKGFRFKFEPRFLKKKEDREKLQAIQDAMIPKIIKKYEEEDKERLENQLFAIQMTCKDDNKWDGWFRSIYNKKWLVFESEEERDKAFNNLKPEVKRKINGVLKTIKYQKTLADKRWFENDKAKTLNVNKSDLIDKNLDISENTYE